jgi:hypothetical protein
MKSLFLKTPVSTPNSATVDSRRWKSLLIAQLLGWLATVVGQAADVGVGVAAYVNFAMHPDTCGGSKLSADWPGALGRVLAGYHGTNHLTLVANSTCGNLNHLDTSWRWPQGTAIEQHRIATILGAAVFQTYKDLKPAAAGPLLLARCAAGSGDRLVEAAATLLSALRE